MPQHVVTGAMMKCTFGVAPSVFNTTPRPVFSSMMPAANILDNKPLFNIMPFGMCTSLANPTVASATSAALGVLTPMPCIPNTPAPWVVGAPTVITDKAPSLNNTACLNCIWGGVITFATPGEFTEMIP